MNTGHMIGDVMCGLVADRYGPQLCHYNNNYSNTMIPVHKVEIVVILKFTVSFLCVDENLIENTDDSKLSKWSTVT